MRIHSFTFLASASILLLSACQSSSKPDEYELAPGEAALRGALVVPADSDVDAIHYRIATCDDETVTESVQPLHAQTIPGNLASLVDNPLDGDSSHRFADLFQVVPAGCYNVHIQPLNADGDPSEMCRGAHQNGIEVESGETTEIFLLAQCHGEDSGAIDIIAAINREPKLVDLRFERSKFVCDEPLEVCALAEDPDQDPLEYVFHVPDACTAIEPEEMDDGYQCISVKCSENGRHDMNITVYDLAWKDGAQIRIEDWLEQAGYPSESRASLNFPSYFDCLECEVVTYTWDKFNPTPNELTHPDGDINNCFDVAHRFEMQSFIGELADVLTRPGARLEGARIGSKGTRSILGGDWHTDTLELIPVASRTIIDEVGPVDPGADFSYIYALDEMEIAALDAELNATAPHLQYYSGDDHCLCDARLEVDICVPLE